VGLCGRRRSFMGPTDYHTASAREQIEQVFVGQEVDSEQGFEQVQQAQEATNPRPSRRSSRAAGGQAAPGAARRHGLGQDLHRRVNVIAATRPPALVLAPNKTLAAQLYSEIKQLFPDNAVEYFVSYYDYYQPEAYIPRATPSSRRTRSSTRPSTACATRPRARSCRGATSSSWPSVSCIYGIGDKESYRAWWPRGRDDEVPRGTGCSCGARGHAVRAQRLRLSPRHLPGARRRHRGVPGYEETSRCASSSSATRSTTSPRSTRCAARCWKLKASRSSPELHYVTPKRRSRAGHRTRSATSWRAPGGAARDRQRGRARAARAAHALRPGDAEQVGFCYGIENYSRHLTGRAPGDPPPTLLDYFRAEFLMLIDESHQTVPQVGAMYRGDRARKETLVEFGFRLPSALDNRPLKFDEFEVRARAGYLHERHAGRLRAAAARAGCSSSRSSGRRGSSTRSRGSARRQPGRRPPGRDSRTRRPRAARAGDDPHQAHGRGPDGVLPRPRA
jgi:hypothetical protein